MKASTKMALGAVALLVFCTGFCSTLAVAQMPTVDVTGVTALQSCPSNAGFYTGDPSHQPACTTGTIGCAGTLPITPTWSITNPTATAGTVVFFTGGGGESAASFPGEEQYFAPIYINANYQVVQISWPSDWEDVNNTGTGPNTPNIRTAACRIASFLKYAYLNIYKDNSTNTAGMCAQGASAGGAGIAYSLTWYGAFGFLDKVVLTSGPPLSDIRQGCQVPNNNPPIPLCPASQGPPNTCNGWPANQTETPEFSDHADAVESWSGGTTWTGPGKCANRGGIPTTDDTNWYHMSIVDTSGVNGTPGFNYPNTSMVSWLCAVPSQEGTNNNSAAQGEIFYNQFTSASQLGFNFYQVNAVTGCKGTEGVGDGTPPPSWQQILQQNHLTVNGSNAIAFEMSSPQWPNRCQRLHP